MFSLTFCPKFIFLTRKRVVQVKKVLNKARLLLHTDKMARQPEKIRLRAELILIEIDKALKGLA